VSGNSFHCTGIRASRSVLSRQVIRVRADWLRSVSLGAGSPCRMKMAPTSSWSVTVIELVAQWADTSSASDVALARGCPKRQSTVRRLGLTTSRLSSGAISWPESTPR